MSKKSSPTLIGIFVVGALILAVAGILLFGSGKFFKEKIPFVMYFEGSLKGLNIGSPVVFRGVNVGSVTDILIELDSKDLSARIPVYIEFLPSRITRLGGSPGERVPIEKLIQSGLKGQLQLQSIVTGQLMVAIDFYPDKPIRLVGGGGDIPELPTISTAMKELTNTIENIPFEEILDKLMSTVDGIAKIVNSPELITSIQSFNNTMVDVQRLVRDVDSKLEPLSTDLNMTLKTATGTLNEIEKLASNLEGILAEDSPTRTELTRALEEFADAARSMRLLADYLERHPEALIRGKGGQK